MTKYYIERIIGMKEGTVVEAHSENAAIEISDLNKYLWEELEVDRFYQVTKMRD